MNIKNSQKIIEYFSSLNPDHSWSFSDSSDRKKSTYITHSYHRYPAKFIPQIVEQLIDQYAKQNSIVCDPFGGCGTTLVESKILGKESIGFDINPVAKLITEAKIEAIEPGQLVKYSRQLFDRIEQSALPKNKEIHPRLNFWFIKEIQRELLRIYIPITRIRDEKTKTFFLCGFSHILKNCSIWLMKSIKPTRDLDKYVGDPLKIFQTHIKSMLKKNEEFYNTLKTKNRLKIKSGMEVADVRNLPLAANSIDLIITSPPYVTSYEYADLHQLSLLWFKYTDDVTEFKRKFIGTSSISNNNQAPTPLASSIVNKLENRNYALAKDVGNYFSDMNRAIQEMYRILRKRGFLCIIIGNTNLSGVKILNAEVAYEQMLQVGFKYEKVIKREIKNQMITPWRDKRNGRFTNLKNKNKKRVYRYEYIIIMRK